MSTILWPTPNAILRMHTANRGFNVFLKPRMLKSLAI